MTETKSILIKVNKKISKAGLQNILNIITNQKQELEKKLEVYTTVIFIFLLKEFFYFILFNHIITENKLTF